MAKNYGGNILWEFFFGEALPTSSGGHGGADSLIQKRLDEDEELLQMIHEFMKKVA